MLSKNYNNTVNKTHRKGVGFFFEHNGPLFTGCSLDDDNIQWDS